MTVPGDQDPRVEAPPESEDIRPAIALPRSDLPTPVLIGIGLVLALALFLFLNARRVSQDDRLEKGRTSLAMPQAAPALDVPPPPTPFMPAPIIIREPAPTPTAPAPPPPAPPVVMRDPMLLPSPAAPPENTRSAQPALIVDTTPGNGILPPLATGTDGGATAQAVNTDVDTARATLIRNRASLVPQGTIVAAVLETPLNSDRPGMARALVSHDARSFDGSRVLIPRGSRLIGEFKGDASPGQRRILVTWTRLIRPDGVAIRIGSPAADALGGAGIAGRVNTHFLERFASAVLQSALTIGVNIASQVNSNPGSIYVGLPSQVGQIGQQLVPNTTRPATIKVREGAEIAIFVARDLDFGGTPAIR